MTNIWLETFLGKIGSYLMNFLSKYYYYIIPAILIYGIFLTLSSYNLKRIEKGINLEVFSQAKDAIEKNPDINKVDLVEKINVPWEKAIKEFSFFPYVSGQSDLWVVKTNLFNIKDIVAFDDRKIEMILERKGIEKFRGESAVRRNLYLEYIHRVTGRKEE
ncbi:MAG: hypothetical protein AVO38_00690 [delta proteobacterium ML8_D]|jgi:hypothetical protein|nr:MAG: hypothetical protein AVO38_00690 [delta proteobacterium ML8_D]